MSDTLKSRTARSAIFIVRESLKSLRQYSADLTDPANIDRIVKESEILSTSLKKLERYLDAPASTQTDTPRDAEISVPTVTRALSAVQDGRICGACGGVIEGNGTPERTPDIDHCEDVGAPERARAHRATEDE